MTTATSHSCEKPSTVFACCLIIASIPPHYFQFMQQLFWKKIEIDNKKHGRPPKLEEHVSLTYLIDQNMYIYIGGKNQFNIKDLIQEEKTPSPPKSDSIAFKINSTKTNARFNSPFGSTQECQDYVYLLDPSTYIWSIKKTTGKSPPRRTQAQVWYEAPLLYVYGGVTYENKTASDMYILNTEKYIWKRFFYLEGPQGRLDFGFATQGQRKYLIGGASMPENLLLDDVWQLSFDNVTWNTQSLELPGVLWEKLPFDNMPPLKGHTLLQISDQDLFIYGGYNKQKQCSDLCLLLDIETYEISKLELKGQSPGPRAYHQFLVVKDGLVCLYGGYSCSENMVKSTQPHNDFYLLNLNEGYWAKPMAGGYTPSPRIGYAISGNQNEMHGEILILGGLLSDNSIDQALYVMHELDMEGGEAWDERNDEEKNKYETYRELKKENKNASVPTLTLEFDEAEKILLEQKRAIGEKEKELKQLQNARAASERKAEQLQQHIDEEKQKLDLDLEGMRMEITDLNQRADENQKTINKIMGLLVQERKRRKLIQRKSFYLEDTFRKTQYYIQELQKVYFKGMNDNLLETCINEELLVQLEQKQQEHKQIMIQFYKQFEEVHKTSLQVRSQLKQNKAILQPFQNVSEQCRKAMSAEDKDYLDKK